MNRQQSRELRGLYTAAGFLVGLFFALLTYITILNDREVKFTFHIIGLLHKELPLIYLIDSFLIIAAIAGYFIAALRIRMIKDKQEHDNIELEKNEFLKVAIQNLTRGNLNADINLQHTDLQINESLKALQARLKENKASEKEEARAASQRNWTSTGLAEVGDLLRSNSSDPEKLSYAIISYLVRYLDINQGGFFRVEEEDNKLVLKMIACHAYERKKFPDKTLAWGEGLTGAVSIEKKSYYTNKIPDNYLSITSGLGKANPRFLLIVPLVLNDEVYGVFELASFKAIENYKISFVERVAENTATTLNIMESNLRTELLLRETQAQAAELSRKEEEVRKNIEELKAIQAEAARQSDQFISFTNTVNHTLIRAEYNVDGNLIYANTKFLKKLGYSGNREVEGKHISMFIDDKDMPWFNNIWSKLSGGGAHFEGYMKHITKLGQDLWTVSTYTCVRRDDGSVEKVLFLAIDSTDQKEESLNFEGQLKAIDKLSVRAEFSPDGKITTCNELFENTMHYTRKELDDKNIFDFIRQKDQERFNEIWEQAIKGEAFQGQLMMQAKFEEEIWLRTTFSSVEDMYGEVEKIVFLAYEITREKEMEISMRDQNEALKKKEEEMKLQSIDLKREIDALKLSLSQEKAALISEVKLYNSILDQLSLPILLINNLGFIIQLNSSAESYFKIKRSKALHSYITDILSDTQTEKALQSFVDPSKPTIEVSQKEAHLCLRDQSVRKTSISIFKTMHDAELYFTLLLNSY